jgi:hypothetical protein
MHKFSPTAQSSGRPSTDFRRNRYIVIPPTRNLGIVIELGLGEILRCFTVIKSKLLANFSAGRNKIARSMRALAWTLSIALRSATVNLGEQP